MECRQCRAQIKIWMKGPGDQSPAPPILDHTQDCPACAATLAAARMLVTGQSLQGEPPPYLARRIMARLRPVRRQRRLVPSMAVIAVAVVLTGVVFGTMVPRRVVVVQFRIEMPEAASVHLVGDFNGWDTEADPLSDPDGDGIWETKLRLLPSHEYRYQFHVDGAKWIPDPLADIKIRDGFGGETSVLQI